VAHHKNINIFRFLQVVTCTKPAFNHWPSLFFFVAIWNLSTCKKFIATLELLVWHSHPSSVAFAKSGMKDLNSNGSF